MGAEDEAWELGYLRRRGNNRNGSESAQKANKLQSPQRIRKTLNVPKEEKKSRKSNRGYLLVKT